MSADEREEVMCMAMKNGAQFFLQKPILADDLSSIWQYCELWRSQRNNSVPRVTQITQSSQAMVRGGNDNDNRNNNARGMSISDTGNNGDDGRKGRIVWESYLHDRFLEAILVIGYQTPTELSNATSWNHMTNQMGKQCQTSFDQNPNYSYTGGSLWKANNVNSGSTTSGTGPSLVHNLSYESNQMGYYGQTTVADQERNVFATGGLVGGMNNNIFTSTNIVAPSSIPFNSEQSINYGAHARNNFFDGNNFDLHQENHVAMVEENQAATGDDHAVDDVDAFISSILDDNTF
ncbi:hypothetical protein ACET3Z_029392 [Daucus carota]